jgi:hypothetical protein
MKNPFRRKKGEKKLARLSGFSRSKFPFTSKKETVDYLTVIEERITERIPIEKLERIYRMEPLIFRGINKLAKDIVAPFFFQYPEGISAEEKKEWEEFKERVQLRKHMEGAVRDALITGKGWIEIVYDLGKTDILILKPINPRYIEIMKEGNVISLDEQGRIKGYIYTPIFYPDTSKLKSGRMELPPERVVYIRFHTLGDNIEGISVLEPIFKPTLIKLNLEESLGEARFRAGFPIYVGYVGSEKLPEVSIDQTTLDELSKELGDLEATKSLAFPWYYRIEKIEPSEIGDVRRDLDHFVDLICASIGVPRGILLGEAGAREALQAQIRDYEREIVSYQESLARQIKEQLLEQFRKVRNLSAVPDIVFRQTSYESQLQKSRAIAVLARQNVITRDDQLENYLRGLLGLPPLERKQSLTGPKLKDKKATEA